MVRFSFKNLDSWFPSNFDRSPVNLGRVFISETQVESAKETLSASKIRIWEESEVERKASARSRALLSRRTARAKVVARPSHTEERARWWPALDPARPEPRRRLQWRRAVWLRVSVPLPPLNLTIKALFHAQQPAPLGAPLPFPWAKDLTCNLSLAGAPPPLLRRCCCWSSDSELPGRKTRRGALSSDHGVREDTQSPGN